MVMGPCVNTITQVLSDLIRSLSLYPVLRRVINSLGRLQSVKLETFVYRPTGIKQLIGRRVKLFFYPVP